MTESQPNPEEGITDALTDLSGQTRALVRREVESAQAEMWGKAKAAAPAAALLALSATLGLAAAASAYRWNLRMLEKALPPSTAALTAVIAYGAGAAWTGVLGVQRLRQIPAPLPKDAIRAASNRMGDAAAGSAG